MQERRIDYYIRELHEMLKGFSLQQFIELYNRTFRDEQPLSIADFSGSLNEGNERAEYISQVGSFEKEEVKRVYNVASQILSRKKQVQDERDA